MSELDKLKTNMKVHPVIFWSVAGVCLIIFCVIVFGKKSSSSSDDTKATTVAGVSSGSSTDDALQEAALQEQASENAASVQAGVTKDENDDALAATKAQYGSATAIAQAADIAATTQTKYKYDSATTVALDQDNTSVLINGQNTAYQTTVAADNLERADYGADDHVKEAQIAAQAANYAQDTVRRNNEYTYNVNMTNANTSAQSAQSASVLAAQIEKDKASLASQTEADALEVANGQTASSKAQAVLNAKVSLAENTQNDETALYSKLKETHLKNRINGAASGIGQLGNLNS